MKKQFLKILFISLLGLFVSACPQGSDSVKESNPSSIEVKSYDLTNLDPFTQITSARAFYTDKTERSGSSATAKSPMLLIVHGYQGKKEDHYHQAKNAAKQGIIAIVFTTSFHNDTNIPPSTWSPAYVDMINIAERETNEQTPIKDKADKSNISLMGHSMGGGGLFHFADDKQSVADKVKTYIALAPYKFDCGACSGNSTAEQAESDKPYPGAQLNKPVLILYGSADDAITQAMPNGYYNKVGGSTTKVLIGLKDVKHNDYGNLDASRNFMHQVIDKYIADWLKIQVLEVGKSQTIYSNISQGGEITELKSANF